MCKYEKQLKNTQHLKKRKYRVTNVVLCQFAKVKQSVRHKNLSHPNKEKKEKIVNVLEDT